MRNETFSPGTEKHLAAILQAPKDFRQQVLTILRREFGTMRALLELEIQSAECLLTVERALTFGAPILRTLPRIDFAETTPEEQANLWLDGWHRKEKQTQHPSNDGNPEATGDDDPSTDDDISKLEADTPAIDDTKDYVSATEIRTKHTPDGVVLDHRKLMRFLDQHSDIRTRRPLGKGGQPRKNRLLLHLADWHRFRDALVEWYEADDAPIDRVSNTDAAARQTAIDKRKYPRK